MPWGIYRVSIFMLTQAGTLHNISIAKFVPWKLLQQVSSGGTEGESNENHFDGGGAFQS